MPTTVLSESIHSQDTLLAYDVDSSAEAEKMAERLEGAGITGTYGAEKAKTAESKPCRETVTKSTNEEAVNDNDMVTSTVPELSALAMKCRQKSPSRTVDDVEPSPAQIEAADRQLKAPCPKSRMPTSDQSEESTTHLMRRCREERILKLFKYPKKLPCHSTLLAAESSASTVPSHQPSTDYQPSDYGSDPSSQQSERQLDSYQNMSRTLVKDPVLSQNVHSQDTLLVYNTDSSAEAEELAERLEGADLTDTYGAEKTKTGECVQSATADPDGTGMRKVQSDDHDVMIRRQNLSSEAMTHISEPSMDVPDAWTPAATAKKTARKDSGPNPTVISKTVAVPRTVVEDISTPLEWDSDNNTSSEVAPQRNVPKKRDRSPNHHPHTVKDGFFSTAEKHRRESGRAKSLTVRTRKIPSKVEEDPDISDSWSSTEESASKTSATHDVTGYAADGKTRQDANNRDNSNSCDRKASYTTQKLDDSDWSDISSDQDVSAQPKPNTQYFGL